MTCREIENQLPAYLEDLLPPEEKEIIREHLVACPSCSKALENLQKMETLLQGLPEVEPPPWLKQKIMAKVREEAPPEKGFFRKLFSPWQYKIPLQTIALLFIAVLAFQIYREEEPQLRKEGIAISLPAPAKRQPIEEKEKANLRPSATKPGQKIPRSAEKQNQREPSPGLAAKPADSGSFSIKKDVSEQEGFVEARPEKAKEMPTTRMQAPATPKGAGEPAGDSQFQTRQKSVGFASREAAKPMESASAPLPASPSVNAGAREGKAEYAADRMLMKKTRAGNSADREITGLLRQFDATGIERRFSGGREIITAQLPFRHVKAFLQKLEASHGETGKDVSVGTVDSQKDTVEIRIELFSRQ